jgi:transposase
MIAKAKVCPHCGNGVSEEGQSLQAVYDKIEVPPVKPIVTRVERYGGWCAGCGQPYVAPVPTGMEPGTPFGASVQSLATYLRYMHAISYERLSALFAQVFGLDISEGGLANLFQGVKGRLDQRVAEILTRLRSSRLICSAATSARVNGQFLADATVPPTNNCSEQAIRMSTVFRKVTTGFRSDWGRDLFATVRSVVNTGKRHGLSAFQVIQKALSPMGPFFDPS